MATFPPRADILPQTLAEIVHQVDHLFLIMNDYETVPEFIAADTRVTAFIPDRDLKDVGKFFFAPDDDDIVFFFDDDIQYPEDFVERSLVQARDLGLDRQVFGYHCSIYEKSLVDGVNSRRILGLRKPVSEPVYVDQVATNAMVALGRNVPPFDYMQDAQQFVDVRYAKWLFENDVQLIALARSRRYLNERSSAHPDDKKIWKSFTQNSPGYVLDEVRSFAGQSPLVGQIVKRN